ncbi:MAG: hypothetical protein ISS78_07330 [Phycisphaerae bacterium]|nr:hypothetical protein [Phycisphaerae bacterium]
MRKVPEERVGGPELPSALAVLMVILSVLFLAGGVIAFLAQLAAAREAGEEMTRETVIPALAWLAVSVTAASVLWALAYLVRREYETSILLRNILNRLRAGQDDQLPLTGATAEPQQQATGGEQPHRTELLQQIAAQLAELKTDLMLSPEQLAIKRSRHLESRAKELSDQARAAIENGAFGEAEQALARFADEVPGDKRCDELRELLDRTREEALARDLKEHLQRVEDLMAVADFDRAEQEARKFAEAHPSCDEAAELLQRAVREGEAYKTDIRQKIYKEVQRLAKARQWRAALVAARKLMETCPNTHEANSIALQMTTLEENARIEEVRQLRDEIRDMIERRRYAEAIKIAKDVMERFPRSRFAGELKGQIDRLRELAAGDGAN